MGCDDYTFGVVEFDAIKRTVWQFTDNFIGDTLVDGDDAA